MVSTGASFGPPVSGLASVAVSGNGTVVVSSGSGRVYALLPASGSQPPLWLPVGADTCDAAEAGLVCENLVLPCGVMNIRRVTFSASGVLWGVLDSNRIMRYDTGARLWREWGYRRGRAVDVTIARDGSPWVIGIHNDVHHGQPDGYWERMGSLEATSIAAGVDNNMWAIRKGDGHVYEWVASSGEWQECATPMTGRDIAVDGVGRVVVVGVGASLGVVRRLEHHEWRALLGVSATAIGASDGGGVWVIGTCSRDGLSDGVGEVCLADGSVSSTTPQVLMLVDGHDGSGGGSGVGVSWVSPLRGVWVKGVDVWESSRIVSALGVGVGAGIVQPDVESSGTGGGGDGEADSGGPSRAWVATAALVAPGDVVERDLALGKPAFQSSDYHDASEYAVCATAPTSVSCTHTHTDPGAWWRVDLLASSFVRRIRVSQCQYHIVHGPPALSRIVPFIAQALDAKHAVVAEHVFTDVQEEYVWDNVNASGVSSVRVQLHNNKKDYLHMSGVEVLGHLL